MCCSQNQLSSTEYRLARKMMSVTVCTETWTIHILSTSQLMYSLHHHRGQCSIQSSTCRICGGYIGTGAGFLRELPIIIAPKLHTYLLSGAGTISLFGTTVPRDSVSIHSYS
jgi:hypothetical protein